MGKRKQVVFLCIFLIIGGLFLLVCYTVYSANDVEEVSAVKKSRNMQEVYAGGEPIGIYMETKGAMVLGTQAVINMEGEKLEPAKNIVKEGDYIIGLDEKSINDKRDLIHAVADIKKEFVTLQIRRNGESIQVKTKPVRIKRQTYQLGIWVRDSEQGIGTITFITQNGSFGALGHGIHDMDTGKLVELFSGKLYKTNILNVKKGKSGIPGGMSGIIVYQSYNLLGSINKNNEEGIYGKIDNLRAFKTNDTRIRTAKEEQIHTGDATIRCFIDGKLSDYRIKIKKIERNVKDSNKGLILEVVDERLIHSTGGIIQGMSGCPIFQNKRLIGAVTHVFVQRPTRGYGITIQNMLKNVN